MPIKNLYLQECGFRPEWQFKDKTPWWICFIADRAFSTINAWYCNRLYEVYYLSIFRAMRLSITEYIIYTNLFLHVVNYKDKSFFMIEKKKDFKTKLTKHLNALLVYLSNPGNTGPPGALFSCLVQRFVWFLSPLSQVFLLLASWRVVNDGDPAWGRGRPDTWLNMRNWLRSAEESNRLIRTSAHRYRYISFRGHRRELLPWEAEWSEALKQKAHGLGLKGPLRHLTRLQAKQ